MAIYPKIHPIKLRVHHRVDRRAQGRGYLRLRDFLFVRYEFQDYFFMSGELAESDGKEPEGKASAEAALHSFDDAFLALEAVEEGVAYRIAEKVIPHSAQYRYQGLPKDAFHIACIAHMTRLKNGLSRLGLPKLDRELAKIRIAALGAIQQVYLEKQQAALSTTAFPHL
jgi:hypothetical protein